MKKVARKTRKATARGTRAGREIIGALKGLMETVANGEKLTERFTVRTVHRGLAVRPWNAGEIRELRRSLGASQSVFALLVGVDVKTIQSWEQGRRKPATIANRLLGEIARDPQHWRAMMG